MNELKKLFHAKRILAMILAVVMVLDTIPLTAYAAGATDNMQSQAGQVTEYDSVSEADDSGAEIIISDEAVSETDEGDEPSTEAGDTLSTGEEYTPSAGEGDTPSLGKNDELSAGEGDVLFDEDDSSETEKVSYAFNCTQLNKKMLKSVYSKDDTPFTYEEQETNPENPEAEPTTVIKVNTDILQNIYLINEKDKSDEYNLYYAGNTELVKSITYEWAKLSSNGQYTALEAGKAPKDAGQYQLTITLPADTENKYDKADVTIDFEITKAPVTVDFYAGWMTPGSQVKDVIDNIEIFSVTASDGKNFVYVTDDEETAEEDESKDNEVEFTAIVRNAYDKVSKTLAPSYVLKGNEDYFLELKAGFTSKVEQAEQDNYEIKPCEIVKLNIADLRKSKVDLKLTAKWLEGKNAANTEENVIVDNVKNGGVNTVNKITVKEYDGAAIADLAEGSSYDYTVKVVDAEPIVDKDGNETFTTISNATVTEWHTALYESWKEKSNSENGGLDTHCNLTVGGKIDSEPVNAGTYVFRVIYEGEEGIYAESYADIVVVIEKAELIIRPVLDSDNTFSSEQTAADVLAKVKYNVYNANTGDPVTVTDRFWGTSYDDTGRTQPYEPVFEVVRIVTTTNKNGNLVKREESVLSSYDKLTLSENKTAEDGTEAETKEETVYKVRFTGYKTVYYANGTQYDYRLDINNPENSTENTTDVNYTVLTDEDTLDAEENTAAVTVTNSTKVEINTDAIVKSFIEKSSAANGKQDNVIKNPADKDRKIAVVSKTYDGTKLFDNRAEYKQAVVLNKDTAVSSNTDSALTYTWYSNDDYTDAAAMQEALAGYSETEYKNYFADNINWTAWYGLSPQDAGIYKLQITYTDANAAYYAEPAYVCFVINKQTVEVVIQGEYSEFSSITPNRFFADHKINHVIKTELGTPLTDGAWYEDTYYNWNSYRNTAQREYGYGNGWDTRSSGSYAVKWVIEQKQKERAQEPNEDGSYDYVDVLDENGNPIYEPIDSWEQLEADGEYRVAVAEDGFVIYNSNYTVSKISLKSDAGLDGSGEEADEVTYNRVVEFLSIKTVPLAVTKMGDTVIGLNTDGIITVEQPYDGTSINLNEKLSKGLQAIKPVIVSDGEDNGEEITDITLTTKWIDEYYYEEISPQYAVNSGTYSIFVSFRGNAKYAPLDEILVAVATITPLELTITPVAPTERVVAGTRVSELTGTSNTSNYQKNFKNMKIEGYISNDEYAFRYGNYCTYHYVFEDDEDIYDGRNHYFVSGRPAWYRYNLPQFKISDAEGNVLSSSEVVKGDKEYSLGISSYGSLLGNYERNYTVKIGKDDSFTTIRGASDVTAIAYNNIKDADSRDDVTDNEGTDINHTLVVLDGIEYTDYTNYKGEKVYGNFVALQITAPAEYVGSYGTGRTLPDTMVYENSIKKMEGYITHYENKYSGYIVVILDAGKGDQSFDITWEYGYTEHFDMKFSTAALLGDLRKAVSPKSISFNSPNKKMVVGAEQILDVKLTKTLKDDVIYLAYKVDDNSVLSVNEYGKVTALKKGSATVTVYPVYLENGVKTEITDKGVKTAKVKITVTDVTAPKISKVAADGDTYAYVQYAYVEDVNNNYGYRREIYVLEGKNIKAQTFEDKINGMTNENWEGIFATAPIFLNNNTENNNRLKTYNKKTGEWEQTNTVEYRISGLSREKDYTVYVRNVSAIRTLSDGSMVAKSAAGNVKSFKTTKAQVKELESTLQGKEYIDIDPYPYDSETDTLGEIWYSVPLSEGSVVLSVYGIFENKVRDAAADTNSVMYDTYKINLPFSSADKKGPYAEPKLTYVLENYGTGYDVFTGEYVEDDWYYAASNNYASIDKKGKITLKQPGDITVYAVYVVNSASYRRIWSNPVNINITARADSIKGKNTTLQVGQAVQLEALLSYKSGKKALDINSSFDKEVEITETLKNSINNSGYFKLYEDTGYVMAIKPGGSLPLNLTDKYVKASASVTIKSTALAPVKNIQFKNVIDNKFTIRFERNKYAGAYRIDVRNGRNTLIRSAYAENNNLQIEDYYTDYYDYYYRTDYDDDYLQADWIIKTENGKEYCEYTMHDMTQQSKYTVTVTALYADESSKSASKAVTTTKLPASEVDYLDEDKNVTGGMSIQVLGTNTNVDAYGYFISGNDYTLKAIPDHYGAEYAATDTLTWTVSDKKVASIKANAGTYSALFKALKQGTTTIEVKSGVTKHIIARYIVTVRAVGDAYTSGYRYYGDNENLRGEDGEEDKENTNSYTELILNEPAAVDLSAGDYKLFAFTAVESGTYSFYRVRNGDTYESGFTVYNDVDCTSRRSGSTVNGTTVYGMDKDETVYIKVTASGSYTMNVKKVKDSSEITPLELNKELKTSIVYNQMFVFTAPEDSFYRFSGIYFYLSKDKNMSSIAAYGSPAWYYLEKDETIYLRSNSSYSNTTLKVVKEDILDIEAGSFKEDDPEPSSVPNADYSWYKFTAPKDAEYTFTLTGYSYKYMGLYSPSNTSAPIGSTGSSYGDVFIEYTLSQEDVIYIRISNTYGSSNLKLDVKITNEVEELTEDEATGETSKTVTLPSNKYKYLSFSVPETGIYQFASENAHGLEAVLKKNSMTDETSVASDYSYDGNIYMDAYLEAGETAFAGLRNYGNEIQSDVKIIVTKKDIIQVGEDIDYSITRDISPAISEYFAFDVEEGSEYVFTLSSYSSPYLNVYMYEALGSEAVTNINSFRGSRYLSYTAPATGTVYWKIKNTDRYSPADVTLKMKKIIVESVTPDSESGVQAEVYPNVDQWFSFTAPESGEYEFLFRNDSGSYTYAYLYDKYDPDSYAGGYLGYVYFNSSYSYYGGRSDNPKVTLAENETVYWKVQNSNSSLVNVTIKVKNTADAVITADDEDGTSAEIYGRSGQWFSFNSTEDALYDFTIMRDNTSYMYVYLHKEKDPENLYNYVKEYGLSYYDDSLSVELYVAAGDTIYWRIPNDNNANVNVNIKAVKVEIPLLDEERITEAELAYGKAQWFSFTPDADAEYEFSFRSDSSSYYTYAYLYDSLDAGENDYLASVDFYIYNRVYRRELSANNTVYWKVINNGSTTPINATIKMKKAAEAIITEDENGTSAEIYGGSNQWFSFTSDEDMRYIFTFTGDNTYTLYVERYEDKDSGSSLGTDYLDSGSTLSKEYYVGAGDSIYWKVSNTYSNNSPDANVNVKVEKVHVEEITDEQDSVDIAAGVYQLFEFTADEDARYKFTFTSVGSGSNAYPYRTYLCRNLDGDFASDKYGSNVTYSYSDTNEEHNSIYTGTSECYIKSGETVYWKVENTGSNSTNIALSVKADKIAINEWPQEEAEIEIAADSEKWFSFKVPEDIEEAPYTFTFECTFANDPRNPEAYLYKNLNTDTYDEKVTLSASNGVYTGTVKLYIEPGKTVYWKLKNTSTSPNGDMIVKMKAELPIVKELAIAGDESVDENTFDLFGDKTEQWFKFTSDEDARYAFTFTASCSYPQSYASYTRPYLYTSLDDKSGKRFEREASTYEYVYLTNINSRYVGTGSWYIPKGNTVYWKVVNSYSSSYQINGSVKVEKVDVNDLTQNTDAAETGVDISAGEEQWFSYTAAKDARYNFTFTSDDSSTCYAYLYDSLDSEARTAYTSFNQNGSGYELYISSGDTVCWKISHTAFAAKNVKVSCDEVAVGELALDEDVINFSFAESSEWISFKAPETGVYDFNITSTSGNGYLERWISLGSNTYDRRVQVYSTGNNSATLTYSLEEGVTAYFRIYNNSTTSSFEGNVSVEQIGVVNELTANTDPDTSNTGVDVSIDTSTSVLRYQWLKFTAPEEGYYRFYSEGTSGSRAWFFSSIDIYCDKSSYSTSRLELNNKADYYTATTSANFDKNVFMSKDETIYIAVGYYDLSYSMRTTVYVENYVVKTTLLTLDSGVDVSVGSGEYELLEFTAPEDGTYTFYSTESDADTYAWFLKNAYAIGNNAGMSELSYECQSNGYGYDDDSGDGNNFRKAITLTAGETIYIAAGRYQLGGAASFTVCVTKSE